MEEFFANLLNNAHGNLLFPMVLSFLGGVATSFSPCVFPMIPITFTVISSIDAEKTRLRPWQLVMLFGLGISLSYVMLGVLAVVTGSIFGALNQGPWFKLLFANILIIIGLNTMGWINLPQFNVGFKRGVNSLASVFLLGFFSGFTLSPCTLPVLSIILAYASTKSMFTGIMMLFCYAWGYNSLLLLIGFFGNSFRSRLPRSGNWLRAVEFVIFVLCLGVGEWLLVQSGTML